MLPDDEVTQLLGDAQQETLKTEVAIGHPQSAFLDQGKDGIDQRPFLGMTVFAQDDVGYQLVGRSEDTKRFPRQGSGAVVPCLAKAVLGGGNGVAIEDMHGVAGDWLRQGTTDVLD